MRMPRTVTHQGIHRKRSKSFNIADFLLNNGLVLSGAFAFVWLFLIVHSHHQIIDTVPHENEHPKLELPFMKDKELINEEVKEVFDGADWQLPVVFEEVVGRAQMMMHTCSSLNETASFDKRSIMPFNGNDTVAALPSFGIIDDVHSFQQDPPADHTQAEKWQCEMPPEHECQETKFTVVLMAYNPDRLDITYKQISKMLGDDDWKTLVEAVILVWNGERSVDESEQGKTVLDFEKTTDNFSIVYPLKGGLPNDLMNRYHPDFVKPKTKAILYYDDDGPFYSYKAVEAGFELWKRHSSAQIGAMSREITYGPRQKKEHDEVVGSSGDDTQFISHCTNVNDQVDYNYRYFANYDANMVLPSGSFLHRNYLCFLWHPVFENIRKFVKEHPVHPDDVTVSMIVSQLAGRAPRVYSRRLNKDDEKHRKLKEIHGRKLLFGIDWDKNHAMDGAKQLWADLRTEAVNSLVRYFGSLNSGSIGWCEGSEYYNAKVDGRCKPIMAKQGWLPWMNPDGSRKEMCP